MKSLKGVLFIGLSMLLTILAWLSSGASQFLIPGLALTTLSLTFILASRLPLLEAWFNGLERCILLINSLLFYPFSY